MRVSENFALRVHVDEVDPLRMALAVERLDYEIAVLCLELEAEHLNIDDLRWLIEEIRDIREHVESVLVLPGCKLEAESAETLRRAIRRTRPLVYLLAVGGGDPKINRTAVSDTRVDLLSHPERGNPHAGLGKYEIELAREKWTYVEIDLSRLLRREGERLAWQVSRIRDLLRLRRRKRFPTVVALGARDPLELIRPKQVEDVLKLLGFEDIEVKEMFVEAPREILRWNTACKHVFTVPGVASLG
ncbi:MULTISPECIES: RNase P subunit p30 family protein [unclassified Methanopyrus]|uniref:RNase P subunit p30 family protein n=1 Tax=Methanopyrus sp. SNP6 TaxID=1937005 RepID=UPI0011E5B07A|nr:RNase P subunit p30 family protein [Methanopyrus sp. SNP6]